MKIRVTVMTENNRHVDVSKEELEQKAKEAWELFFTMINAAGDSKAIVEKCEVVEM